MAHWSARTGLGGSMSMKHRRYRRFVVLSAIALVLMPGLGIAQSKGNFLSRFEGNYSGTMRRATTSLLGGVGHPGSSKADATSTSHALPIAIGMALLNWVAASWR